MAVGYQGSGNSQSLLAESWNGGVNWTVQPMAYPGRRAVLIGNARTSIDEPDPAPQLDALTTAGCERCFTDTASGSGTERPQLALALAELRDDRTRSGCGAYRLGPPLTRLLELIGESGCAAATQ
jgi:hypothetical protein